MDIDENISMVVLNFEIALHTKKKLQNYDKFITKTAFKTQRKLKKAVTVLRSHGHVECPCILQNFMETENKTADVTCLTDVVCRVEM